MYIHQVLLHTLHVCLFSVIVLVLLNNVFVLFIKMSSLCGQREAAFQGHTLNMAVFLRGSFCMICVFLLLYSQSVFTSLSTKDPVPYTKTMLSTCSLFCTTFCCGSLCLPM